MNISSATRAALRTVSDEETDRSNKRIAWTIAILATIVAASGSVQPLGARDDTQEPECRQQRASRVRTAPRTEHTPEAAMETKMTELQPPIVENACTQWKTRLPLDYEIYAAGAYRGRDLEFAMDDSNHRATRIRRRRPRAQPEHSAGAGRLRPGNLDRQMEPFHAHRRRLGIGSITRSRSPDCSRTYRCCEPAMPSAALPVLLHQRRWNSSRCRAPSPACWGGRRGHWSWRAPARSTSAIPIRNSFYVQGQVQPVEAFRDASLPLAGDLGIEQLLNEGKLRRAPRQRPANAERPEHCPSRRCRGRWAIAILERANPSHLRRARTNDDSGRPVWRQQRHVHRAARRA